MHTSSHNKMAQADDKHDRGKDTHNVRGKQREQDNNIEYGASNAQQG